MFLQCYFEIKLPSKRASFDLKNWYWRTYLVSLYLIDTIFLSMKMSINSNNLHSVCYEVQVSVDEIRFLTEGDDPYDDKVIMKKLHHYNLKLLVVTEGERGCRYYTKVLIHKQELAWSLYSIYFCNHNVFLLINVVED